MAGHDDQGRPFEPAAQSIGLTAVGILQQGDVNATVGFALGDGGASTTGFAVSEQAATPKAAASMTVARNLILLPHSRAGATARRP